MAMGTAGSAGKYSMVEFGFPRTTDSIPVLISITVNLHPVSRAYSECFSRYLARHVGLLYSLL